MSDATHVVEAYSAVDDHGPVGLLARLFVCSIDHAVAAAKPYRGAGRITDLARTTVVAECVVCAQIADRAKAAVPVDHRAQLVAGLRQLADWYEANPDVPMPTYPKFSHCVNTKDDDAGRATVTEVAAALGVDHDATAYRPSTTREFAGLTFEAFYVPEEDMATYAAKQDAIRELVAAGWKPGHPVPTPAEDPLQYSREVDGEVTGAALPDGVEGIPVSSPPHGSARPVSAPPAPAEADECPDPWHTQRDEPTEPCPACNEPHPTAGQSPTPPPCSECSGAGRTYLAGRWTPCRCCQSVAYAVDAARREAEGGPR